MSLDFLDFELPLLKALIMLGGQARPKDVYPEVETILNLDSSRAPEEYSTYKGGAVKWKNKTAWAQEYLKRKGQIDLGFMIEGIRSSFPDALLRIRNTKGTWNSYRAEFEFKSSNCKLHKHKPEQYDLLICWGDGRYLMNC